MVGIGLRSAVQHDNTLNSIVILQRHGVQDKLTGVTAAIIDIAILQSVRGKIGSVNSGHIFRINSTLLYYTM